MLLASPFGFAGYLETLHLWRMQIYIQADMLCEGVIIQVEQKHSWLDLPQRGSSRHRGEWRDTALQQQQRNNVVVSQNRISGVAHFRIHRIKKKNVGNLCTI